MKSGRALPRWGIDGREWRARHWQSGQWRSEKWRTWSGSIERLIPTGAVLQEQTDTHEEPVAQSTSAVPLQLQQLQR